MEEGGRGACLRRRVGGGGGGGGLVGGLRDALSHPPLLSSLLFSLGDTAAATDVVLRDRPVPFQAAAAAAAVAPACA